MNNLTKTEAFFHEIFILYDYCRSMFQIIVLSHAFLWRILLYKEFQEFLMSVYAFASEKKNVEGISLIFNYLIRLLYIYNDFKYNLWVLFHSFSCKVVFKKSSVNYY